MSLYAPGYLTIKLDRDATGWPAFVGDEGKAWMIERVKRVLDDHGPLDLHMVEQLAWNPPSRAQMPESLRGVALWDLRYAVIHRALLDVDAEQVWRLRVPA